MPVEIVEFLLMRKMRWSWRELQEAPVYVRTYCAAFLDAIAERQKAQPVGA